MSEKIPEAAHPLLDEVTFAHVVTLMPDGMPQTTPVWVTRDGDVAVFNTAAGRAKHRNLVRDPRCALSVTAPDNPYTYLQLRGTVELVEDGAVDGPFGINALSHKYMGRDYPFLQPGEQRLVVRLTPDAVDYHAPPG